MNFQDRWPDLKLKVIGDLMQQLLVDTLRDTEEELLAFLIMERELGIVRTSDFNEPGWVLTASQDVAVRDALNVLSEDHPRRVRRIMKAVRKGRFVFPKLPPQREAPEATVRDRRPRQAGLTLDRAYEVSGYVLELLVVELHETGDDEVALAILGRKLSVVDSPHFDEPEWVLTASQADVVAAALGRLSKDYFFEVNEIIVRAARGQFIFVKPQGRMTTILVADDDSAIRALVADLLSSETIHVLEAADGEQALALARSEKPSLILLDLLMPKVYGGDVAVALRNDEELSDMAIVIMTGVGASGQMLGDLRIDWILTKPFDSSALIKAVAALLD